MADTPLRLEAAVVDKFSKPLTDLKKQLASVKGPNLSSSQREFQRFHEEVKRATTTLKDGLGQAMSGLGVQSLAGVGAIAGVTAAVRKFAATTGELKALAQETGITAQALYTLQQAATQLGSSPDAATASLRGFAKELIEVRRGTSKAIPDILAADPSGELFKALKNGTPTEALNAYLTWLGKVNRLGPKAVETAGKITEELTGSRDFSRMLLDAERAKRAFADVEIDPEMFGKKAQADAERFNDLLAHMERSAKQLGLTIGQYLLPSLSSLLDTANKTADAFKDGTFLDKAIAKVERFNEEVRAAAAKKDLLEAKKRLEDFDKKPGSKLPGEVELRPKRRTELLEDIKRLEDVIKEGSKEGVEEGLKSAFEKMSFRGGGSGGALITPASFGGPVAAANRRYASGGRFGGLGGEVAPSDNDNAPSGGAAVDPGAFGGTDGVRRSVARGRGLIANQREAYRAARGEGLSNLAARALVANFTGESLRDPSNRHFDVSHFSQGIAQWDPARVAAIKAHFGKEPRFMTVAEQTRAAILEIRNNPRFGRTREALEGGGSAQQTIDALVRNFESPANPGAQVARRLGHFRALGDLSAPSETAAPFPRGWRERAGGSAFDAARGAGVFGLGGPQTLKGSASLDVRIRGGNADVRTTADGLFDKVNVNRSRAVGEE